jgi:hypothetical protein
MKTHLIFSTLLFSLLPTLASAAPPANDNFANAQVLATTNGTVAGSNVDATIESGEPVSNGSERASIWYRWTATFTGTAEMDTIGSAPDTTLTVYTGTALNDLVAVAYNNDINGLANRQSRVTPSVTSGLTYYIAVRSDGSSRGAITLNFGNIVRNDAFADAVVVSGSRGYVKGFNQEATAEPGETGPSQGNRSAWYTWTAPYTGTAVLETRGSTFDTLLTVYTGSAVNSLTQLANDDDSGGANTSRITMAVTNGTVYRIAVRGFSNSSGDFLLSWSDGTGPGTIVVRPATALATEGLTTTIYVFRIMGTDGTRTATLNLDTSGSLSAADVTTSSAGISFSAGFGIVSLSFPTVDDAIAEDEESGLLSVTDPLSSTYDFSRRDGGVATYGIFANDAAANDNFANRTVITGDTADEAFNTAGLTSEVNEPAAYGANNRTLWYEWTAASDGVLRLAVTKDGGGAFSALARAYQGSAVNALTLVEPYTGGPEASAYVTYFRVTQGSTYHIQMTSSRETAPFTGNLNLSVVYPGGFKFDVGSYDASIYDYTPQIPIYRYGPFDIEVDVATEVTRVESSFYIYNTFSPTSAYEMTSWLPSPPPTHGEVVTYTITDVSKLGMIVNPASTVVTFRNNDHFASAVELPVFTQVMLRRLRNAHTGQWSTLEPGEPSMPGFNSSRSVWFKWTAPSTGAFSFRSVTDEQTSPTVPPPYVAPMAVYAGTTFSDLTLVAEPKDFYVPNAFGGAQFGYTANFWASEGETYYIAVRDAGHDPLGRFNLQVTSAAQIRFVETTLMADEANPGATYLAVERTVIGDPNLAHTVELLAIPRTADASDYTLATPVTITIPANQYVAFVTLPIVDDGLHEVQEHFDLILRNASGECATDPSAICRVYIQSNDSYAPSAGKYSTFFSLGGSAADQGQITLSVTATGSFTGTLKLGGKSYPLTGALSSNGTANLNVVRPAPLPAIPINIASTANGQRLEITVGPGMTIDQVTADRQTFDPKLNTTPSFGKYTAAWKQNAGGGPLGDSVATISVALNGAMTFVGSLSDGSKFTTSGILTTPVGATLDHSWSSFLFFFPKKAGFITGDLDFNGDALTGTLVWVKVGKSTASYYPGGFTCNAILTGGRYTPPALGTRVIPGLPGSGLLSFSGDNGSGGTFVGNAYLLTNNTFNTSLLTNPKISLKLVPATGLFTGTVTYTGGKALPTTAVVLQSGSTPVRGFFLQPTPKTSGLLRATK